MHRHPHSGRYGFVVFLILSIFTCSFQARAALPSGNSLFPWLSPAPHGDSSPIDVTNELFVPLVVQNDHWQTVVEIANRHDMFNNYYIAGVNRNGQAVQIGKTIEVHPHATAMLGLDELFGADYLPEVAALRIYTAEDVNLNALSAVSVRYRPFDGGEDVLLAVPQTAARQRLFVERLIQSDTIVTAWEPYLIVANSSSEAMDIWLQATGPEGPVTLRVGENLSPYSQIILSPQDDRLAELFGQDGLGLHGAELTGHVAGTMAPLAGLTGTLILIGKGSEGADVLAGWMLRGDTLKRGSNVWNTGVGVWYLPLLVPHGDDAWSRAGYFNGDAVDHILWLEHYHPDGTPGQSRWRNVPAGQTAEWDLAALGFDLAQGGMIRLRVQELTLGGSPYWMFGITARESAQPLALTAAQAPAATDAATHLVLTGTSESTSGAVAVLEEDTLLNLINPGNDPATCTIRLRNIHGQPAGETTVALAGNGSAVLALPTEEVQFEGQIEIVADQPVIGLTTRYALDTSGRRLHAATAPLLGEEVETPAEESYQVTLTVRDHFSGAPIAGIYYISPFGGQGPTDTAGRMRFTLNSPEMRFFTLFTRPDAAVAYMTRELHWHQFTPDGNQITLDLTLARKDQPLPEITAARLLLDGSLEEFDLLTEPVDIMQYRRNTGRITLDVNPRGWKISGYRIQQGIQGVLSQTPEFTGLAPGERFVPGSPIYAILETDLRRIAVPLKLRIRENPDWKSPMETLPSTDEFQVGSQIPFLNNSTVGVDIGPFAASLVYEDNKLIVFLGIKDAWEDNKLLTPSKVIKDIKEAGKNYADAIRNMLEWGVIPQPMQHTSVWKADVGAMGFVTFRVDDPFKPGEFQLIDGGGYIYGSGALERTSPIFVVFVPCFVSMTIGAQVKAEFTYHSELRRMEELFSNVTLTFIPGLELEAGVGMKGVASVSVAGKGDIPIEYKPRDHHFKVDLHAGAEFRIVVYAFLHYEKTLAEKTWSLYPGDSYLTASVAGDAEPAVDLFDMALYTPAPRAEEPPEWVGHQDPPPALGPVREQVVIKNVLAGTEPRLLRFGNREILLWIDDDPGRDDANRAALMYMVRWVGGKFDEKPQHVLNLGTNDVAFDALVHKGDLFVTWQNINTRLTSSDRMLEEMCRNSQIHVARYSRLGGGFTEHHTWSPTLYENNPRLASDGDTLGLFVLRNSSYAYFRNKGMNQIDVQVYDGRAWRYFGHFMDPLAKTVVTYAPAMDRGIPAAAVVIDLDGDLGTINDRVLRLYRPDTSRYVVEGPILVGHPIFARHHNRPTLFWFQDHDIYYQTDVFSGSGQSERVFGRTVEALTDEYDLLRDSENRVRAILWTDSDMQLNAEAVAAFYIEKGGAGQWGQPVPLTTSGRRVEKPHGFINSDGSAVLTYRALQVDTSQTEYRRSNSDLVVADVTPAMDLALAEDAIFLRLEPQPPGTDHPFDFTVSNYGTLPCEGIILEVLSPGGAVVKTMTFSDTLLPGESVTLKGKYPVPNPLTQHTFSIRVKPLKGKDLGTSSKTAFATVGLADVQIIKASIWRPEPGMRHTRVRINNLNYVAVPEVVLVVKEDDRIIKTSPPFALAPMQAYQYEFVEHVDESNDPTYNHQRSYSLEVRGVPALNPTAYQSVTVNPFRLLPLTPSIHGAQGSDGSIRVEVSVLNNHPAERSGTLLLEVLDRQGRVVDSSRQVLRQSASTAELITKFFSITGEPDGYTVRASIPRDSLGVDFGPLLPGAASLASDVDVAVVVPE